MHIKWHRRYFLDHGLSTIGYGDEAVTRKKIQIVRKDNNFKKQKYQKPHKFADT